MHYAFSAPMWRWSGNGPAAWRFVTVPTDIAHGVRIMAGEQASTFGSIRIAARIGDLSWNTSLFPDSKSGSYLLPIKAEVRRKAGLSDGDMIEASISLDL